MKKLVISLLILISSVFAVFGESYDSKYQGTYIPEEVYATVTKTHSYYEGIVASKGDSIYTVLAVTADSIKSNKKFHDAFVLKSSEINFAFEKDDNSTFIIDKDTKHRYRKISNSTDYRAAYRAFISKAVLTDIKGDLFGLKVGKDSVVKLFNKDWKINLDQWHYSEGLKLIIYTENDFNYLGITEIDGKNCLVTLASPYDLVMIPVEKITANPFDN